jgi:hypothetical protein
MVGKDERRSEGIVRDGNRRRDKIRGWEDGKRIWIEKEEEEEEYSIR